MRKIQIPKINYEVLQREGIGVDAGLARAFELLFEEVLRDRQKKKNEKNMQLQSKVENQINKQQ